MYFIGWIVFYVKRNLEKFIERILFILFYLFNTDMVLCFPGESLPIFFNLLDGCDFTFNISEGNFFARIERLLSEAAFDATTNLDIDFDIGL